MNFRKLKSRLLAGICLMTACVQAVEFVQTDQFVHGESDPLTNEMWVSAQIINITGTASNDLFMTAPVIQLNGGFYGDVWATGDQIDSAGIFHNDVRLLARTAQISGTVYGTFTGIGTTTKIERTANLYGDALCFGENAILEGLIHGSAHIIAKSVTIGGRIDGDVSVTAQDIVVLPNTILNGDLNYTAPQELVLSSSVMMAGDLNRRMQPVPAVEFLKPNLSLHFMFALAALMAGLIFSAIFPRYTATTVQVLRSSFGPAMLTGLAAFFLIPLIAIVLLFTFVGLPISLMAIMFYLILLYLSKIVVGFWLGMKLFKHKDLPRQSRLGILAVGLIIIYALTAISVLSLPVNVLIMVTGLGALLLALFKKPVLVIRTPDDIKNITTEG